MECTQEVARWLRGFSGGRLLATRTALKGSSWFGLFCAWSYAKQELYHHQHRHYLLAFAGVFVVIADLAIPIMVINISIVVLSP